jgi:class I fructose-bisphosphate aldolase
MALGLLPPVQSILASYESESAGVRARLVQLLTSGSLGGSGKFMVYAVDQGFEHGPGRSFSMNPLAYHPYYHAELAIESGFSALAAPLGFLDCVAHRYAGQIPWILKLNHGYALHPHQATATQAVIASVDDALRLGCIGVGFTIYPGSSSAISMFETVKHQIAEAKRYGLLAFVWSYPRGEDLSKEGETALDIVAYGVHLACLLGAHVIKSKIPTAALATSEAKALYPDHVTMQTLSDRVRHVMQSAFDGQRLVAFSGGEVRRGESVASLYDEASAICAGGAHGSMIGRNCYKRSREEALEMIATLMSIYRVDR